MAVTKQKPCINDTVLQLAKEAAIGEVFIYSGNEYQWTMRSEAWEGIMLTKTERGFELIDKNGRSHGIVNLGEPYHNIDPHPSCTACAKDYVFQNAVECITAVCCDQELYVGNCAEKGWSVDWCELNTEQLLPPTLKSVFDVWRPAEQPNDEGIIASAEWGILATPEPQDKLVPVSIKLDVTIDNQKLLTTTLPIVDGVAIANLFITDLLANTPYTIIASTIDDKGNESEQTTLTGTSPQFNVGVPTAPYVHINPLRADFMTPHTDLHLEYDWGGSDGGAPLQPHKLYLYKDDVLLTTLTDAPADVPFNVIIPNEGDGLYKLVGEASNVYGFKATSENSLHVKILPLLPPTIELEFGNFGGTHTNDVRAHIDASNASPYAVSSIEWEFTDNTTAQKYGVIEQADGDGKYRFTVIDPYPNTGVTVRARTISLTEGAESEWTEVEGVVS